MRRMKIKSIKAWQIDLPLKEGRYSWSEGKYVDVFDSTVVAVETDEGVTGYGEVCPLGPFYLPAYAAGARSGIQELGPQLLGHNPIEIEKINYYMDRCLQGHPYVKSALDMAFWDILGKVAGLPVCELLGGRYGEDVILYRAISQQAPELMAASVDGYKKEGYTRFQLKVGGNPNEDIERIHAVRDILEPSDTLVADANTGWLPHQAMRVVKAVNHLDVYIEQPCTTYEECLGVRNHTDLPFILDENINGLNPLLKAHSDRAMDAINIKISKFGGLTRARQARDLAVHLGLAMTLEDSWGGDIITAAISHLAHSTPEEYRFTSTDFNSYVSVSNATGAPQRENGRFKASREPGLGITPRFEDLGDPVVIVA